jgi:[pyruvate, water dikinase]-phosphate phosphotransferase / [pyruvate, water dikinase] kinase
VPGVPLPDGLAVLQRPLIVGLTKDAESLVQIRKSRMLALNQGTPNSYIDPDTVREEVVEARRLFARQGWPVIDVTRRAIEETAAEIMILVTRRAQATAPPMGSSEPKGPLPQKPMTLDTMPKPNDSKPKGPGL